MSCLETTTKGSISPTPSVPSKGPLCMAAPHRPPHPQKLPLHELAKALHPAQHPHPAGPLTASAHLCSLGS